MTAIILNSCAHSDKKQTFIPEKEGAGVTQVELTEASLKRIFHLSKNASFAISKKDFSEAEINLSRIRKIIVEHQELLQEFFKD